MSDLPLDPKALAFAQGLAKFVGDVKADTGPGAASGGMITAEILTAAVGDLVPAFADFSDTVAAIKADKVKFALALADSLESVLGL